MRSCDLLPSLDKSQHHFGLILPHMGLAYWSNNLGRNLLWLKSESSPNPTDVASVVLAPSQLTEI